LTSLARLSDLDAVRAKALTLVLRSEGLVKRLLQFPVTPPDYAEHWVSYEGTSELWAKALTRAKEMLSGKVADLPPVRIFGVSTKLRFLSLKT
jgi:hypothetical protein